MQAHLVFSVGRVEADLPRPRAREVPQEGLDAVLEAPDTDAARHVLDDDHVQAARANCATENRQSYRGK